MLFPPHRRGWTVHALHAQAGMDRGYAKSWASSKSFPRTGGDGPATTEEAADLKAFPPHRRGWTVLAEPIRTLLQVSPAQAGMDRSGDA